MTKLGMKAILTTAFMAALLVPSELAFAQNASVEARISTREAFVGSPVLLEIQITNANDYQRPPVPQIDGCDVRFAGAPSQSSQITIINGVRDEKKIITLQYVITPRREGKFEIPELPVQVDNKKYAIKPQRFVATKSETGDLLFVEIEGGRDKVYVGQPLDLKLKIWIKPFRDHKNRITLAESTMWRLISRETSWGSFSDRLSEMANTNQRPRGQEVLRDDGKGNERAYYLYEIDTTVYPKRPGRIDADDVSIIVQYPTALGRSSDPFDRFFQGSPFRQNPSRLSNMFDDDFFGGSPFGNRLAIKSARPIVAAAQVDETEVLAVPMEGRPADYRGAVGQYQILTQATTTSVAAGDPINLNIGIIGTGPMELVQAPPLSVLSEVTKDFKVNDAPLAGFVQDETKMFSTTLRPRNEEVTEIPSIPFSYFDPDAEKFVTVRSKPISIDVSPAETLSLDGLAAGGIRSNSTQDQSDETSSPSFSYIAPSDGASPPFANADSWPWIIVFGMPVVWIFVCCWQLFGKFRNQLGGKRTAKVWTLRQIEKAESSLQLSDAVQKFIEKLVAVPCTDDVTAVGHLRSRGYYSLGTEVESFFSRCNRSANDRCVSDALKFAAAQIVESIDSTFSTRRKPIARKNEKVAGKFKLLRRTATVLFVLAALSHFSNSAIANNSPANQIVLSESQQKILLEEFETLYREATDLKNSDSAESKSIFMEAAKKGQLLVDNGFQQTVHLVNLGNAYLQSGQLGWAIASYEMALSIQPNNSNAIEKLEYANAMVQRPQTNDDTTLVGGFAGLPSVAELNSQILKWIGPQNVLYLLALGSFVFWGLLILQAFNRQKKLLRWSLPALVLLVFAASLLGIRHFQKAPWNGVLVTEQVKLRSGDGSGFGEIESLEAAEGQRVRVVSNRGNWFQVETPSGNVGWLPKNSVVLYGQPDQSLEP